MSSHGIPIRNPRHPNGVARRRTQGWPIFWFRWALVALAINVIIRIVVEYGSYFPADFESSFLFGREGYFLGLYSTAFYLHIVAGPVVLLLMGFLIFSGHRRRLRKAHRTAGKIQIGMILLVLAPSGLVMSFYAYSGPIAGVAFALQSIAVAFCAWMVLVRVRQGKVALHRRWANRCNLVLLAPILLRLNTGLMIVCGWESVETYRIGAWGSWLVPLLIYEIRLARRRR